MNDITKKPTNDYYSLNSAYGKHITFPLLENFKPFQKSFQPNTENTEKFGGAFSLSGALKSPVSCYTCGKYKGDPRYYPGVLD